MAGVNSSASTSAFTSAWLMLDLFATFIDEFCITVLSAADVPIQSTILSFHDLCLTSASVPIHMGLVYVVPSCSIAQEMPQCLC